MKISVALFALALCAGAGLAQQPADTQTSTTQQDTGVKQDMKTAGHSTKKATKKTVHKTKKATKKGAHKAAQKTSEGANKVEDKTQTPQ